MSVFKPQAMKKAEDSKTALVENEYTCKTVNADVNTQTEYANVLRYISYM